MTVDITGKRALVTGSSRSASQQIAMGFANQTLVSQTRLTM